MALAYIALGSNLGDRLGALRHAVQELGTLGRVTARSSVWETAAVGPPPDYLNAVVALETPLEPLALLSALLGIEAAAGRRRRPEDGPAAPRTLDLDLLFHDDRVLAAPGLVVPHPRLHERAFVLAPLSEIAPELEHPVLHHSIGALRAALRDPPSVRHLDDPL